MARASHGLGPGTIVRDGRQTEVRLELKDLYSTIEEAKADVMGIYDILALIERGEIPAGIRAELSRPTSPASSGPSASASARPTAPSSRQFNYLLEKGALAVDEGGRYRTVPEKFPDGIRALLHDMLMLQATGDYAGTRAFLERYGQATPPLLAAIERLKDLPVDLAADYPQAR